MTEQGARRQKVIALILSGVFPGLGQLYNRQPTKGAAFVVAGGTLTWLLGRAVPGDLLAVIQPEASLIVPLIVLLIVWAWSVIDAWRVAGR